MAEDLISIGIALNTGPILAGTRQVDTALKQVAAASTTTAQATQKIDAAAKTAGQALTGESQAAQTAAGALRQETQATQSASQATSGLSQAARQAAATLSQTGQAAQSAGSQLGGMGSAMRSFASQTGSFALAQAGVMGLQQALGTAKAALEDLVRTGMSMQNLRTSFTAASGSVQAGAKDFQFVTQTALTLGLGLESVAAQYRSLSAATRGTSLQGAETRELFVTLSKAAQAYGLSTEQLGRVMSAFQQIISKGKVSMEELRGQLGDALPGALQIAARAYGVTTQAFEDMVSKGLAAEGFTRRWTAQLATEIPTAAAQAGKGITNLGTEIVLLKEAIAQSGLLRWLDNATAKTAGLLGMMRKAREERQKAAEEESKQSLGPGVTIDKIQVDEKRKLVDINKELAQVEAELKQVQDMREASALARVMRAPAAALLQGRIDALKKARDELGRATTTRSGIEQSIAARQAELAEPGKAAKAAQEQEKEYQAFLKEAKAREAAAKKAEAAQQAASKVGLGRDPDLAEKVKLQEKLVKENQEWLETNYQMAERGKDDPAVKALRERGKAQEALSQQQKDAKKDAKDDAREAKAAEAEQDRLDKERRGNVMDTGKLILKGYEEEGDKLTDLLERTHKLSMTEEDRWALMIKGIKDPALREYGEELLKQYETALRYNEALKERPRLLADEARASAAQLSDLNKAMAAFTPGRKGEKPEDREKRLTDAYTALTKTEGVTMLQLTQASEKMDALLKPDMWKEWEEVGLSALDHVGQALEEFVFKGKLNFKDMMGAIAQDLFRFATQTLMQSATKKGGWLEAGLDLGLKALGLFGGGMPTSGTLPTTEAAYAAGSAAGLYSGRQHGGPAYAGQPYMVGEAGPELFVPRTSGTVVPHGQGVSSPTVVNVHVSGVQDAQSFVQSRGAVSRAMMGALAQARQQM